MSNVMNELSANTDKSIQALQKDLLKVRTGRASTALIDHVHVDYYGNVITNIEEKVKIALDEIKKSGF